jgi:two-component system CheB/CheR fusion protein
VAVTLRPAGDLAEIHVRDTGVGIAPDVLAQVCEPFVQAPQAMDRSRGGLGLGLATVKGLVEMHGGTISLASAGANCGTDVAISLPLAQAPTEPSGASRQAAAGGRRVLVVEDNLDAADGLKYALSLCGHKTEVAYDGPSALSLSRQFHPDIVICDIGLPGMDGYAVARAFRSEKELQDVYLVALSGYAQPDDRRRATTAGFDQHLAKPTDLEKLEVMINEAPLPVRGSGPELLSAGLDLR